MHGEEPSRSKHDELAHILKLDDFEELARDSMDLAAYSYYAGGAADELTMRDNVDAFGRYALRPRMLVDVSKIDPTTELLGIPVSIPVGLCPNAQQMLGHDEAETATARAAASAGVLMALSTFSSKSLEDVAAASDSPKWFQLYIHRDKGITTEMVERVTRAGYRGIVLTVDLPVPGYRERELRHPVRFDDAGAFGNFLGYADSSSGDFLALLNDIVNDSLTWDDVEWLRSLTDLPIVLKGILTAEDARLAVDNGMSAVWVSNHGGRQLDRVPASVDVLEEVVEAVAGRAAVFLDGGVRRGTDVLIALALGADGVFIGRPYLWALAAAGEKGVVRALELITAEFVNAMALLGVTNVGQITRSHVTERRR